MLKSKIHNLVKLLFVVWLLGISCKVFAGGGDVDFTDNIIMGDGQYIGLGANKGRLVFGDELVDWVSMHGGFFGVSNATITPAVQFHIKTAFPSGNDIKELFRMERYGEEVDGQSGIGLSQTFYLENQSEVVNRVGALIWEYPTVSSNPDPSRFSLECHTGDGGLKNLMRQQDEWLGFLDTSSGYYMWISPAVTGANRILSIDMAGQDRQIIWTGAGAGEYLYVEGESKIESDLTEDADVTHNDMKLSNPSDIYDISHDSFMHFDPCEHIDWENATSDFLTTGTLDVGGVTTITGLATGGRTDYDLKVGDTTTPDYGMIQFGNAVMGRTSYKSGQIDLDGTILFQNIGGPVTSQVEFCIAESSGNSTRFALAKSGDGNATYNSRSMLIAGPAPADTNFVMVSYWQLTENIFDNLDCNTGVTGADLGVQNDLEVEGDIFVDSIKESTPNAGITFSGDIIAGDITSTSLTLDLTQDYKFDERSTLLTVQGQTSGQGVAFELSSLDADGTDTAYFGAYGQGSPSSVENSEFILMGISSTTGFLYTGESGTGDALGLEIGVAGDTDLLSLAANALTVNGTLGAGATTLTGNLIIPDAGNIGSASDTDAIAIAANGDVGIGIAGPKSLLHLSDGAATSITSQGAGEGLIITGNSTAPIYFEDASEGANDKLMTLTYYNENLVVGSMVDIGNAWNVQYITVFNRDGSVGIGTSSPGTTLDVTGDISVGGSNNELRFYEGVNYVGFEAPALSADQIWKLPTADGLSGEVMTTNGSGTLSFTANASEKTWAFMSRDASSGTNYIGGFYKFGSSDNDFNPSITFGTANVSYAAHFFLVQAAGASGGTDTVIRVTGTTIDDQGNRTATVDVDITVDDAGAANTYYETTEKWLGQVTIAKQSGPDLLCNYGFAKYWDNNNTAFKVVGIEATWLGAKNDAAPDIELRHHKTTGWTYNNGAEPTPPAVIASMATDHNTEIQIATAQEGAWKRDNLSTNINGGSDEGTIIELTTTTNRTYAIGNFLIRITPQ